MSGPNAKLGAAEAEPEGPIRRCVACRKAGSKSVMIRFCLEPVSTDGADRRRRRLRIDPRQIAPGRGAYCHAAAACAGSRGLVELIVRSLVSAESGEGKEPRPAVERPESIELLLEQALGQFEVDSVSKVREELKRRSSGAHDRKVGNVSVPKLRL
jgi:predicted RNA-binding protein YlxR (DUF448 family)